MVLQEDKKSERFQLRKIIIERDWTKYIHYGTIFSTNHDSSLVSFCQVHGGSWIHYSTTFLAFRWSKSRWFL